MSIYASAINDTVRLDQLYATQLLDSPSEAVFDQFTSLASKILNAPTALVSLVDKDRQFFKSYTGLGEPYATTRQTPLSHSFCQHVVGTSKALVIEDARGHAVVGDNLAIRDLGVIAYLGIPLTTPQGKTLGSFCVIDSEPHIWSERDITILTELALLVMTEIELRLMASQFLKHYNELQDVVKQRDEVIDMLVHDLRSPLTSFIGGLQLMDMTGHWQPEQKSYFDIALRGGNTLLRMIDEILEVSKNQSGQMTLQKALHKPATLVQQACELIGHMAKHAKVNLIVDCDAKLPAIHVDGSSIKRVLVNLLSNAIQHTPADGRVKIEVALSQHNDAIFFSVSDTGTGIAHEAIDKLFIRFGQSQTQRLRGASSGIGLAYCKAIAEAHGGMILVESVLSVGSNFSLKLPLNLGHSGS